MKPSTLIITLIIISGSAFWLINHDSSSSKQIDTRAQDSNIVTDTPAPADFVSLRPELDALASEVLSQPEIDGMIYMREEEKLARDVYMTLYEKWNLQIFSNIAQSEQTHTEAIRDLLVKYNLSDPVINDNIGEFTNPDLQKLYTDLTSKGLTSLNEALTVGATIEDLDIRDINVEIGNTDNADIILVYDNLIRGSRNHLRSFIAQLESREVNYEPQYISLIEFNEIIDTQRESGNGGKGGGRGWGNKK